MSADMWVGVGLATLSSVLIVAFWVIAINLIELTASTEAGTDR